MHHPLLRRPISAVKYFVFILLGFQCPALLQAQGFLQFYTSDTAHTVYVREIPGGYDITGQGIGANQWVHVHTDIDGRRNSLPQYTPTESDSFSLYPLRNGDFLASRYPSTDSVLLQRRAPDGALVWEYQGALGGNVSGTTPFIAMEESLEGDLYFYGQFSNPGPPFEGFVFKLSGTGQFVWSDIIDLTTAIQQGSYYFHVRPVRNGECLILNTDNNNTSWTESDDTSFITRKSADGQNLADFEVHFFYYTYSPWQSVGVLSDGTIYQFIADEHPFGPYTNVRLRTYDNAGNILMETNITELFQAVMNNNPYFVVIPFALSDGNLVLAMASQDFPANFKRTFVKITPEGELLWLREIPQLTDKNANITYITEFSDGSIGFGGSWSPQLTSFFRLLFLKFGANGDVYPNNLKGTAARDENDNCLVDTLEQGLPYWILNIDNGVNDWYTFTNPEGKYSFQADTGNYSLSLTASGYLWEVCDNPQIIDIQTDTTTADYITDFSVTALADCSFMQVDIAAPYLRAGVENTYYLKYCNLGTITAADVVVSVEVDPLLEFVSASFPHQINDGVLEFHLGEVDINDCGYLSIVFAAADNPELYGQSICVTAHIRPDSICLPGFPGWSGALLEARGVCDGDSVRFEVKNIGHGPSTPTLEYIIADDHVIMYSGELAVIQPNELLAFSAPANGASWRFSSEQEPNVPAGTMPSVQVEGCTADGPPVSQGIAVQTPNQTGSPFSDTQCLILLSDGEPPTLSADPVGIPPLNLIEVTTEIEYLIHFHPDDLVHQVVIIDTLPADLDLTTFSPGPSSHAYSWSFGFDGALYFYITGNDGLQEGFVQFAVKPKPGTPDGTVITNQATLYYDQSASEPTNSVFHTIGHDTISGVFTPSYSVVKRLQISPNPASEFVNVQLPFVPASGTTLVMRNVLGQIIWEMTVSESTIRLYRNHLPAGLYWLECRTLKQVLATGKIIWQSGE